MRFLIMWEMVNGSGRYEDLYTVQWILVGLNKYTHNSAVNICPNYESSIEMI